MSYEMPDKLKNLEPYEPNPNTYRIRLDANESFIEPSSAIKEKIGQIVEQFSYVRYPDPTSSAVCEAFGSFYGVKKDLITAGNGSDELISVIIGSFLSRGDKIMLFTPDFSMYSIYCGLSELQPVLVPKNSDLCIDIDGAIRKATEENIRAVIFSNPCNPTGQGIGREEMRRFVRSFPGLVILDEAYMDFWDQSLLWETEEYDNLILLRTCSKAVGLASLRLGFAVSNRELTRALKAAKSPFNVNSMTQAIGTVILSDKAFSEDSIQKIRKSVSELYEGLTRLAKRYPGKMKVYPTCTNFVYLEMSDARELFSELLKTDISIRYFKDGFLRITCGTPDENREVLAALEELLKKRG